MKHLPSQFHKLLATVTDTYEVVAEHPRNDSLRASVWEVESSGGTRWFAKQNASSALHQREIDAYQRWIRLLGPDRAPQLVAHDPGADTLLVTAVPGTSLDELRLPAEQECEAYRQAGSLLSLLHAAEGPDADGPKTRTREWALDVDVRLDLARSLLTTDQITMLRELAVPGPLSLPLRLCHGDYMPKNWLWDEREQRLRIIDFERTRREPPAQRDLSRLYYRVLAHRPDLDAAFQQGYSCPLSSEERQARTAHGVLDALDALWWGRDRRDIGLVDEAHTMIENLRLEHTRLREGGRA